MSHKFVELHILRNVPFSNLNRDETGQNKTMVFGGRQRARISSQCLKYHLRHHPVFAQTTQVEPGVRTRYMAEWGELRDPLLAAGLDEDEVTELTLKFAEAYAGKLDDDHTNVMLFVAPTEMRAAAQEIIAQRAGIAQDDKVLQDIAARVSENVEDFATAPNIAMFGRFLAARPAANIDAACQVAHAFSTHTVETDLDFFTAVDDLAGVTKQPGSGHMGYNSFNSACYYTYMRVDWQQLVTNLGGNSELALRTIEGFLRAATIAVPTGFQNSTAPFSMPSLQLGVVRNDGMSWSLANAFVKPVNPTYEADLVAASVRALEEYWAQLTRAYGAQNKTMAVLSVHQPPLELQALSEYELESQDKWLGTLLGALQEV